MNAITLTPSHPGGRPALDAQVLAVQNADVLSAIAGDTKIAAEIAAATGRDPSNLRKTLDRLRREGLIGGDAGGPVVLTPLGDTLRRRAAGLAGDAATPAADPDTVALTCAQLASDPANPRKRSGFSAAEIEDMAISLRAEYAATGRPFITPPTVYPLLQPGDTVHLIAKGERRWRGWCEAVRQGWIPEDLTVVCPVYRGDPAQALASAIVENLQRADLDPLEEAEAFAALAERINAEASSSPVAEICRQIGKSGESGERFVQERLRVARTATPEAKARFIESRRRAAAGEPDPDPFLWKHLRDSVKIPRHVTALDKSPALRLLVLEMGWIADAEHGLWDGEIRIDPTATLPGGLLDQAVELDLVEVWPAALLGSTAALTQKACDWLAGKGFGDAADKTLAADADPDMALITAARAEVLTPDQLAALGEAAATPFLNPPAPPQAAATPAAQPDRAEDEDAGELPAYLRRLVGATEPDPATVYNGRTYPNATLAAEARRRAEGEGGASSPLRAQPAGADMRRPSPAEQLIIVEVAWAAEVAGGGTGFATAHGFHSDAVALSMIPHWLLTRMGAGATQVALTRHAQAWLAGYYEGGLTRKDLDACRHTAGCLPFDLVEQLGRTGAFATRWLNPPLPKTAENPAGAATRIPEAAARCDVPAGAEGAPPNLDPVALMRQALTGLWLAAGDHYAAAQAVLGATLDDDQAAREDATLADAALTLQRALATAATFVPAEVKARLEHADHD